jgi:hypothetical protein
MRPTLTMLIAAGLLGCGARSQLDALATTSTSGGGAGDPCPSAVTGPRAMTGSCSTRDGRSRVAAPTAPHVTWTTKLPTDSSGTLGTSAIATGGSGEAYVVTEGAFDESVAALRRVSVTGGTIEWAAPITPDEQTSTPVVLASGGVDLFAYDASTTQSLFTFDASSGTSTSTTFGVSLYDSGLDVAVGADGSLYVTHSNDVGEASPMTFISRIAPGGAVLWTTADLGTLGPPPQFGDVDPSVVALGKDDLVVVLVGVITASGDFVVADAFEPATGVPRWSTTIAGSTVGGPVVMADGTIAALVDVTGPTSSLVLLDTEGMPTISPLASGAFEIFGVTTGDLIIAGADTGNGVSGIVALRRDGSLAWTFPGPGAATLDGKGTILAYGPNITALDEATGATKWQLTPPVTTPCVIDAALASDGSMVALLCDGTLFGARD